jgi:DNA-binding IscR family transcriptional regulator
MPTTSEPVPLAVREWVRERILALEQLEILLLLQQRPAKVWSLEELAGSLSLQTVFVEAAVAHLGHHGLISDVQGRYRYAPSDLQVADVVAGLAFAYANARVEVLALVSSDAVTRVRHRARQLMRRLSDRP